MNLANKLTIFRIILIPVYIVFLMVNITDYHYLIAVFIFILAALTDYFDGKIARKYNYVTDFGKFADPLADKLLVLSAMICFVQLELMPAWICIIIMAREITISGIRLICANKGTVVAASILGKIKTVFQMAFVLLSTVNIEYYSSAGLISAEFSAVIEMIRIVLMYIALAMTVISLADYIIKNKDCIIN